MKGLGFLLWRSTCQRATLGAVMLQAAAIVLFSFRGKQQNARSLDQVNANGSASSPLTQAQFLLGAKEHRGSNTHQWPPFTGCHGISLRRAARRQKRVPDDYRDAVACAA